MREGEVFLEAGDTKICLDDGDAAVGYDYFPCGEFTGYVHELHLALAAEVDSLAYLLAEVVV